MTKLKNSHYDKTQKPKKSICGKTQIVTKNSNCDKAQKLKL